MTRYIGPKNKLARRENFDLFGKGVKLRRLNVPPGIHGYKSGQKKLSEYGQQLREKKKVKRFYGVLEKQFKLYYDQATKIHGKTGEALLQKLERRLDNVLVRAGFCPTRSMARQVVVHMHVKVNNQIVNRPSYQVKPEEMITLSEKVLKIPSIVKLLANKDITIPKWLKRQAAVCLVTRLPERDDISEDFQDQLVVEFYSR